MTRKESLHMTLGSAIKSNDVLCTTYSFHTHLNEENFEDLCFNIKIQTQIRCLCSYQTTFSYKAGPSAQSLQYSEAPEMGSYQQQYPISNLSDFGSDSLDTLAWQQHFT